MKRLLNFVLLLVIVSLACARSNRASGSPTSAPVPATPAALPPVPAEYQATYDELQSTLATFVQSLPPNKGEPLMLGAELLYANSNAGEALLKPEVLPLVEGQLDALHAMGVDGVVVAIKFPMLEPDFPHSVEYLQFYKQVSTEIHKRGMKFLVEAGPVFSGTIYSPLSVDWSKYNQDSFIAAQQNELVTIANEIQPDYLQIADEPGTIAMLSGVKFTPADYAAFIQSSIEKIGHRQGMKLGAGSGTWEDPAYMNDLMNIQGLDCIDIHIYPIGRNANLLERAYEAATQARASGKCAVISEAWLYKVSSSEMTTLSGNFEQVYGRDAFSFWEPLDESFIRAVTKLSQASGVEFVSFFWTRYFFAYLDYDQYHTLTPQQINRQATQASIANTQTNTLSPLGTFFRDWIAAGSK
jgi:hypothetical protein